MQKAMITLIGALQCEQDVYPRNHLNLIGAAQIVLVNIRTLPIRKQ